MDTVTITVELTEATAWELAQFCKRSTWSTYRDCAVSDDNAYQMRDALSAVWAALRQAGYDPR